MIRKDFIRIVGNNIHVVMGFWCMKYQGWISESSVTESGITIVTEDHIVFKWDCDYQCDTCRFFAYSIALNEWKHIKDHPRLDNIRIPIAGEMLHCGVCFSECHRIDREWINEYYDKSLRGNELWKFQQSLYDVGENVFLGYCGCEDNY